MGYFFIVVGILFVIDFLCCLFMLKSRIKKITSFFSIIIMIILLFLTFYITKTTGFLSNLDLDYKTYNYSVVTLKDGSYMNLKELSNETLGYYDDGTQESSKALKKVKGKINLETNGYNDTHALASSLLDGEVEAILLEDSHLEILNESLVTNDEAFQELVKHVYQFSIQTKTSDISRDINVTTEPFNIYVSGIDTYGEISSVSRSDVNMVVTVNPDTRQILLTSIPRDYYVSLHGKSGYKDKLTHAGLYGTDMSIQTIEDLLDIKINYYMKVNFSSVIQIVEAIGGVNVYSDYDFTSIDGYHYDHGYNEVNGEEALSFARERKAFATGDRQRVKNQQALLQAVFAKCMNASIITKYSKLLDSFEQSFVTNMKMSRMTSLVKLQLSKNLSWNMVVNSLNGSDDRNYTYSAPSQKVYVMSPLENSVLYGSQLINQVLDGKVLNKEEVATGASDANRVTQSSVTTSKTENKTFKEDNKKEERDDTNKKNTTGGSINSSSKEEKLKVRLGRSSVSFVEGDEYIYYGYTALYNGDDVTDNSGLVEKFSINGKVFDNYPDLVFYVSGLENGNYTIIYTIQYKGESAILEQDVEIKELKVDSKLRSE